MREARLACVNDVRTTFGTYAIPDRHACTTAALRASIRAPVLARASHPRGYQPAQCRCALSDAHRSDDLEMRTARRQCSIGKAYETRWRSRDRGQPLRERAHRRTENRLDRVDAHRTRIGAG